MHSNSASNLQNSANIWSVVEFVEQLHEIEVVPISWLVVLNKQKTLCKWPPKNPRKYIRNNIQPDSSWKEYRVQVLIQSDSYQKALNYAKKKSNSETDTSYYQLGKGKRRKKHKSQDVTDHSDSESTQRMTPPPSITIPHDTCTEETGEEESNYNKNIEDNTAIEEESDVNNNNGTPTEKTSDKVNKQRTQENNIAATPNRNEDYAMEDIIEELPTDNQAILKILQNVVATRRMVEQQNQFLKQLESQINIDAASNAVVATNPNIEHMTNNTIPTKPFNKYRKLLEFDDDLRANIVASKQLEDILLKCKLKMDWRKCLPTSWGLNALGLDAKEIIS
ncbi:uncharacterized protein [Linepithema humile]|uniref:uncharacterized protein isoform X3 n=1 Tax=Linepithema humile TaxID=83485 RepID=UPI00351F5E30